jgi:predicted RNA-binding Zn-ribbon protein involved in translation (DUF1610 family)
MAFPCPGCGSAVERSLETWATRCPACGEVIRSRVVDGGDGARLYEVEITGKPETRKRISVAWSPEEGRRLRTWLAWSTALTLGLVVVLYVVARLLAGS